DLRGGALDEQLGDLGAGGEGGELDARPGAAGGPVGVVGDRQDPLDEVALARVAGDQALVAQHAQGQPDGVAGRLEPLLQLLLRGDARARGKLAALDLSAQGAGDLAVSALFAHARFLAGYRTCTNRSYKA